jgi:predicted nuclease of predicted toxin-antitoxin system
MNLSPSWVDLFVREGWEAIHWVNVGLPKASDTEIMEWAASNGHVVFTHDLDFGAILAIQRYRVPSVIQLRTQDVLPDKVGRWVAYAVRRFEQDLERGALVSLEPFRARARILPLR